MNKTKVKANANQLSFLRQQMVLYPNMGHDKSTFESPVGWTWGYKNLGAMEKGCCHSTRQSPRRTVEYANTPTLVGQWCQRNFMYVLRCVAIRTYV